MPAKHKRIDVPILTHILGAIGMIREIFPMFELTLDGLENAVSYMMRKS